MKRHLLIIGLLAAIMGGTGCNKINNKEVPAYTVRLDLSGPGVWNVYGVSGVGEYRSFNRPKGIPANFPYNVNTYTGYGGVLLMMALDASTGGYTPVAYDASCPVESSPNITVGVDSQSLDAVCPSCGSHYDVLQGSGGPKSGVAATSRLGLRIFRVRASSNGGYIITNS